MVPVHMSIIFELDNLEIRLTFPVCFAMEGICQHPPARTSPFLLTILTNFFFDLWALIVRRHQLWNPILVKKTTIIKPRLPSTSEDIQNSETPTLTFSAMPRPDMRGSRPTNMLSLKYN